jgi:hypothetical protein
MSKAALALTGATQPQMQPDCARRQVAQLARREAGGSVIGIKGAKGGIVAASFARSTRSTPAVSEGVRKHHVVASQPHKRRVCLSNTTRPFSLYHLPTLLLPKQKTGLDEAWPPVPY